MHHRYNFFFISFLILIISIISSPLGYAEAVNSQSTYSSYKPPVEKKKKKAKKRKFKKFKNKKKAPDKEEDIVPSLYTTFGVMILLPVIVIIGILLVALGIPNILLALSYIGAALILLGNIAAMLTGGLAGAANGYSTQILSFALWVLFGINIAGLILLLILGLVVFSMTPFLWAIIVGLGVIALFMLVWALIINIQNKPLRNSKNDDFEEVTPSTK